MKLIRLSDLARRLGLSRRSLLTRLRAIESDRGVRSMVIIQAPRRTKGRGPTIWVRESVLQLLHDRAQRDVEKRLDDVEGRVQAAEINIDDLRARLTG